MMIRFARPEDVDALLAIYAQYIDTPSPLNVSCPGGRPSPPASGRSARITRTWSGRRAGARWGYAYAHRQMERAAYQWNAELSVYLDREHTGQGAGAEASTPP